MILAWDSFQTIWVLYLLPQMAFQDFKKNILIHFVKIIRQVQHDHHCDVCFPMTQRMSLVIITRLVSVLCFVQYADWKSSNKQLSSQFLNNYFNIQCSTSFDRQQRFDAGLTIAVFQSGGKVPVITKMLTICVMVSNTVESMSLSKFVRIMSNSQVLFFMLSILCSISSLVFGERCWSIETDMLTSGIYSSMSWNFTLIF